MKYSDFLNNIKEKSPLIHHITNYVTVNDCANISLAIGASPIMTAYDEEFEDIADISSALALNIGTMDKTDIYEKAVKIANSKNVPVVFDPVGVGASKARNNTVQGLLSNGKFCVIKGNVSEIMAINGMGASTKGVDASQEDKNTDIYSIVNVCKDISKKYTVYFVSGNHEYRDKDWKIHKKIIESFGVRILDNKVDIIRKNDEEIYIYGLKDPAFYHKSVRMDIFEDELKSLKNTMDELKFGILLSHRPDKIDIYARNNVELAFTGHAHGGQIRILGKGILSPAEGFFPKYTAGIHKKGNTTVIISRGLGRTIFTSRLFNKPEVVITRLKRY